MAAVGEIRLLDRASAAALARGGDDPPRQLSGPRRQRRDRGRPRAGAAAADLDGLAQQLRHWRRREGLSALIRGTEPAPKGRYIFGAVGRGKTMLMDLFFETTTFRPKRRLHFHEFMAEVHELIGDARKSVPGDPIPHVGKGIAARSALLCFDELHVTDIADAMILGRLFRALFEAQVVVVATSNVPPGELYKNGLNRALFLPFIELIGAAHGGRGAAGGQGLPARQARGQAALLHASRRARQGRDGSAVERAHRQPSRRAGDLDVKGRKLRVPLHPWAWRASPLPSCAMRRWARATSSHIAHAFHTVMIDAIPCCRRRRATSRAASST